MLSWSIHSLIFILYISYRQASRLKRNKLDLSRVGDFSSGERRGLRACYWHLFSFVFLRVMQKCQGLWGVLELWPRRGLQDCPLLKQQSMPMCLLIQKNLRLYHWRRYLLNVKKLMSFRELDAQIQSNMYLLLSWLKNKTIRLVFKTVIDKSL